MANYISAGVYSTFYTLFTAPQNLPTTRAFIAFYSDKGRDNEIVYFDDPKKFMDEYGGALLNKYGMWHQGFLNAYTQIRNGMGIYAMRVLPNNWYDGSNHYASATRSNIAVRFVQVDNTQPVETLYEWLNIETDGETAATQFFNSPVPAGYQNHWPAMLFYATGRGEWYNRLQFRFTKVINKEHEYIMDIYIVEDNDNLLLVESWIVSFVNDKYDDSGANIFIENVLQASKYIRCKVNPNYTYEALNEIIMNANINAGISVPDVVEISTEPPTSPQIGDKWFIAPGGVGDWDDHDGRIAEWDGSNWVFHLVNIGGYFYDMTTKKYYTHYGNGYVEPTDFYSHDLVFELGTETYPNGNGLSMKELGNGSDGDLWTNNGTINNDVATKFMADAYGGLLDPKVYDTESILFDLVYDAKYPVAVKDQIYFLASALRKDCHAFIDGNDAVDVDAAIKHRKTQLNYSSYFVSVWYNYSKVIDPFTSREVWVAPSYHLSYVVPRSDIQTHLWFSFAGLRRGVCDMAKEVRWIPSLGERDNLYLNQMGHLAVINETIVIWNPLTTLKVPTALQDIDITRLMLYVDRMFKKFCIYFVYEKNDQITYNEITGGLVKILEDIKKQRGIDSYSISVHADDYDRKLKQVYVDTIITPTRSIEKIILRHFID